MALRVAPEKGLAPFAALLAPAIEAALTRHPEKGRAQPHRGGPRALVGNVTADHVVSVGLVDSQQHWCLYEIVCLRRSDVWRHRHRGHGKNGGQLVDAGVPIALLKSN